MTVYNEKLERDTEALNLYIMKRSGKRVPFDKSKIVKAIQKANGDEGLPSGRVPEETIRQIADGIEQNAMRLSRDMTVEEIQDMVEEALMCSGKTRVARHYITWRYEHAENRKLSDIDQKILGIISRSNEDVKQENSNKNPTILSTQRDYMAGEWSRYFTEKYILPRDVEEAHKQGIIHFHDSDYAAMAMHNCCLINLDDMLQNGTCISGTKIDKPKAFQQPVQLLHRSVQPLHQASMADRRSRFLILLHS